MSQKVRMKKLDGTEIFVGDKGCYFALEQTEVGVLTYYEKTEHDVDAFLARVTNIQGEGAAGPTREDLLNPLSCSLRAGTIGCSGNCSSAADCIYELRPGLPGYCWCKPKS